jgi:hypothetical protein
MGGAEQEIDSVRIDYRSKQWALIRNFVRRPRLAGFCKDVLSAPSRRVTVGSRSEWWSEHQIDKSSSLGEYLRGPSVFAVAQYATDIKLSTNVSIWAQSYNLGERIAWHRDGTGEVQLLICLQSTDQGCGGRFCIRWNGKKEVIDLLDGDAILFRATALPHCTTRVLSPERTRPRITAVARFFAESH